MEEEPDKQDRREIDTEVRMSGIGIHCCAAQRTAYVPLAVGSMSMSSLTEPTRTVSLICEASGLESTLSTGNRSWRGRSSQHRRVRSPVPSQTLIRTNYSPTEFRCPLDQSQDVPLQVADPHSD